MSPTFEAKPDPAASWIAAADNRFGVAILDLIAAGADPAATGPSGETARDIAVAEGKAASVAALDTYR
jgi:hypothetical protein